jgi:ribosomal protein S15
VHLLAFYCAWLGAVQGLSFLANIGGPATPQYLQHPPQEELLERYFHPDHMSSEEKMKLELQRVRDEFKMSENDCGSARVQIAQLTVKIKHLSTVLHKKDKHSRKGLQDMVQRRKKYLKYLRRTDWDSYCLVLSKLGLRDVPEYKAPDYKNKSTSKAKSKKSKSKKRKMKA